MLHGQATCQTIVCIDELRIAGLDEIHDSFLKHFFSNSIWRDLFGVLKYRVQKAKEMDMILHFVKAF